MSRSVRVNELVLRELSSQLHTRFRDRAVGITFTEADVAPDLRTARIYYSVFGGPQAREQAQELLAEIKSELRQHLGKRVVLKYTPTLEFTYDTTHERGNRILSILDDLAARGEFVEPPAAPAEAEPNADPPPPPAASDERTAH